KVQSPKSKVQSPKSKVQSPKSKAQSPKSKAQSQGAKGVLGAWFYVVCPGLGSILADRTFSAKLRARLKRPNQLYAHID
ncbi:MAG: hypothetical protein WCQ21_07365, partial [Verrucomicrobiota bacterium]